LSLVVLLLEVWRPPVILLLQLSSLSISLTLIRRRLIPIVGSLLTLRLMGGQLTCLLTSMELGQGMTNNLIHVLFCRRPVRFRCT
jgi:hypothetical protein